MKTLKTFYLLTLSTLLSLAACSKDEGSDTPQPLTIEQTEYTLDAIDNRSTTLSFTASAAWTLSVTGEDSDWLTVTPSIGTAGSKSVTPTAAPRITEESRTAYVDIACGAQTVQITVTQTGASADADFTSLFDPVFADFLHREIGFVTENSLPARGLKTPPKSSFFTGHPVCRNRFLGDHRILVIFTRNWLRKALFLHITAHKNGANPAWIYPVKRLDSIQFFANKCSICSLVLSIQSAFDDPAT